MDFNFLRKLVVPADSKIALLVMDGLGGIPRQTDGKTELETAQTPNLDQLAARGLCGLHQPVAPGITPGSGPSHLALFGYDPIQYQVGRGVLSALGIDFDLGPNDVAARGNFCTLDEEGAVADRRAGRISTQKNRQLVDQLRQIELPGVELFIETVKEYRLLLVLRGAGLSGDLEDTDPQDLGVKPSKPRARSAEGEKTAQLVSQFLDQARRILADHHPANMVLLRGFAKHPDWPQMEEVYGVKAAALAAYPMYRGVAKLVGMQAHQAGDGVKGVFDSLEEHWDDYDYFYLHIKPIDSAGEDGDFSRKVELIEEVDEQIPRLMDLDPKVVLVTGDHSTPWLLRYHSWHPVPVILWSPHCRADRVHQFGERACMQGGLGTRIPAVDLMPLALANAGRLEKFGA